MQSATLSREQQLLRLQGQAGNQAVSILLGSENTPVGSTAAIRNSDLTSRSDRKQRHQLSAQVVTHIKTDIDVIVSYFRKQILLESDEHKIIALIRNWAAADRMLGLDAGTPHMDQFLFYTKVRGYKRSTGRSGFIEQSELLYNDLFHELEDDRLEEFKALASTSREYTGPPGTRDLPENFWATMGKKQAIGVWGILKGMGTSIAGMSDAGAWAITRAMQARGIDVAEPASAAEWLAKQYDISGNAMFGKEEWSEGEELFLGMSAAEFSTRGGEFVWQLVMMGKGGGAKWLQVVEKALSTAGNLKAVEDSAKRITGIIERMQKDSPAGKVDIALLLENPDFYGEVTRLVANVFGALAGGSQQSKRIAALLEVSQLAPLAGSLVKIGTSNVSTAEKSRQMGPVLMDMLKQIVSTAGAMHSARGIESTGDSNAPKRVPTEEKKAATPIAKVAKSEKTVLVATAQRKVSRKTMAGAGEPPVKTTASRTKQPKAVEQLQEKMAQEATHQLAPRKTPETPVEVKGGLREPRYRAPKEGSNTVGKPTKSLEQARKLYDDVIAEISGKHEVGIWQKEDGTYVVRIGQMTEVDAPRDWRPVQHFHTNAPDIPLWRMPARADVAETSVRAAGTGHPVTELVEYPLPDGKRGRAAYTVNPDNSVKIEFVDQAGQRIVKEFPSVKDYNDYHDTHKVSVEPGSESYKSLMKDLDKAFGRTPSAEAADTVTKTMAGSAPKKQKLTSKGNKKGLGPSSAPQKIDKSRPATKASPSRKEPVVASPSASRTSTEWLTKRGTSEYRTLGMKVLRGRFSETPAMKQLWKRASQGCQQSDAGYDMARERFWKLVATSTDDDARLVRTILKDAGYETPMGRAANVKMTWATKLDPKRLAKLEKTKPDVAARLRMSAEEARRERTPEGLQAQQRKESIEHAIPRHPAPGSAMEKKAAKYPNRFLDPANLRMENLYENMLMGNKPSAN